MVRAVQKTYMENRENSHAFKMHAITLLASCGCRSVYNDYICAFIMYSCSLLFSRLIIGKNKQTSANLGFSVIQFFFVCSFHQSQIEDCQQSPLQQSHPQWNSTMETNVMPNSTIHTCVYQYADTKGVVQLVL